MKHAALKLTAVLSLLSFDVLGQAASLSDWVGTAWTDASNDQNLLRFDEFDGELQIQGNLLFRNPGSMQNSQYSVSGKCVSHALSKDGRKLMLSYAGCGNTDYDGRKVICEKTQPDVLRCTSSRDVAEVTLTRTYS